MAAKRKMNDSKDLEHDQRNPAQMRCSSVENGPGGGVREKLPDGGRKGVTACSCGELQTGHHQP